MARGIKLNRFQIKQANHWFLRAWRLRVEVAEVFGDMDPYVFVYRRHPADPNTGDVFDEFCTVAGAVDLTDYPVDDPDPDKPEPFFRKDFVEVDVRSSRDYEAAWEAIRTEVCNLIEVLNRMDVLELAEELWCGDQPPSAESDASDTSDSASDVSIS